MLTILKINDFSKSHISIDLHRSNNNVEIELRSGCKIGQNFYRKIYIFPSIFYFVQRGVTNAYVVCKNSISEFLNSKITFTPLSTPSILFSLSLTPPVDQIIS